MLLFNIQYLRGLAALMVVVFHVLDSSGRLGVSAELPKFELGEAGVDLFFVVSGFIIWLTTRKAEVGPVTFLMKRARRVVPLYWSLSLLMAAVALLLPSLLQSTVFDPVHLLSSLAFWPYPHPTLDHYNPILFIGWTLNYETAFYLVFALLLPIAGLARAGAFVVLSIAIVLLGRIFRPDGALGFYTDPIVLEFALGVLIGAAYTSGLLPNRGVSTLVLFGGFVLLFLLSGLPVDRAVSAGLPMALVVFGAVFLEKTRPGVPLRLPLLIGSASYAIYLTHIFMLPVSQIVWREVFGAPVGSAAIIAYVLYATAACLTAGVFAYWLLERPLDRLIGRAMAMARSRRTPMMTAGMQ